MGTCFMIDFCYFEDSPDDKNNDWFG
jgi:hypothetical protein